MGSAMPKHEGIVIRLQYSALPAYRQAFVDELVRLSDEGDPPNEWLFLVGDRQFHPTVKNAILSPNSVPIVNHYLLGRKLLWQSGVAAMVKADVAITELNPRVFSTWVWLAVRRLLGRPTLLWGHAWPRAGAGARSDVIRGLMRALGHNIVTYTAQQAQELRARQPRLRCFTAPNAIFPRAELNPVNRQGRDIVYVGRLVPEKKVDLLIRGYDVAARGPGELGNLVIVGSGTESDRLQLLAADLGIKDSVLFTGEVTDYGALRAIYSRALCSASPGYVGLSATQSLGFGVPMVWASDELHAPEVVQLDASNSVSFESDSPTSLAAAIMSVLERTEEFDESRDVISSTVRDHYSAEVMAFAMRQATTAVLAHS